MYRKILEGRAWPKALESGYVVQHALSGHFGQQRRGRGAVIARELGLRVD
jgi:hypothetical protein